MESHWVAMSSAPKNTLYDDLKLSVRAIERAKRDIGTTDYTPEVRERANQIAQGQWAGAVIPLGRPAWLRD